MEHIDINSFNYWAKKHLLNGNRFDKDGFIIIKNVNDYKSTGIIAGIFEDNWNDYYSRYKNTIESKRPNDCREVNKIIDCSNHNLGASVYVCPNDFEVIFSHHTCKRKLCSSCSIKSQKLKVENILDKCINCKHRHITFTIPNGKTMFFLSFNF